MWCGLIAYDFLTKHYQIFPDNGIMHMCIYCCVYYVQVGLRLVWSSRNQKFTGLCMTHNELSTLCDVYQTLSPNFRQKQTSYVLQTLWRDLTSDVS